MSELNAVKKEFSVPDDFIGSGISLYLESRRFDRFKVKQVLKAVEPIVNEFNAKATCLEDLVKFRISMSAKHQTLTAKIAGYDNDTPVNKFDDVIGKIECAISELLEEEIMFEDETSYALADID